MVHLLFALSPSLIRLIGRQLSLPPHCDCDHAAPGGRVDSGVGARNMRPPLNNMRAIKFKMSNVIASCTLVIEDIVLLISPPSVTFSS